MVVKIVSLILSFSLALLDTVASAQVVVPPVPANLNVPSGQPFLLAKAEGTQNYVCVPSSSSFVWAFYGPQATLFDPASEQQIITHFLSPNPDEGGALRATWQHSGDTSAVWAAAIASSTDPGYVTPGAIPWLLLQVKGTADGPTGGDALAGTLYIQRVNTAGGAAPVTGCKNAKDVGKKALVPYTTDYVFYR
jgi:uncharacterized protein DUF3455